MSWTKLEDINMNIQKGRIKRGNDGKKYSLKVCEIYIYIWDYF